MTKQTLKGRIALNCRLASLLYRYPKFRCHAERIWACRSYGRHAMLCHDPYCLVCQGRKAYLKEQALQQQLLSLTRYEDFLPVTLTMCDCRTSQIRNTASLLTRAFKRLRRMPAVRRMCTPDFFRCVEVARNPAREGMENVHSHGLIGLKGSHRGTSHLTAERWSDLFNTATEGRGRSIFVDTPIRKDAADRLLATAAYICKGTAEEAFEYRLQDEESLLEYLQQMEGLHRFPKGGGALNLAEPIDEYDFNFRMAA